MSFKKIKNKILLTNTLSKAIASLAVCGLGAFCMYLTKGETGVGWAILGLMIIW